MFVNRKNDALQTSLHDQSFAAPPDMTRCYLWLQFTINVVFSTLGLLGLLIVIPIVWICNRFSAPGPLFYWQNRVGHHGQPYQMLKLRTMRVDAEAGGPRWAEQNDARVTAIGRFLRKTHLDELPQVYNILRGQMNVIGPRPERPEFTQQLVQAFPHYEQRYEIKPGVTGWAQVNQMYSASVEETETKLAYDLFYIQNRSWKLDLTILLRTINVMTSLRGR